MPVQPKAEFVCKCLVLTVVTKQFFCVGRGDAEALSAASEKCNIFVVGVYDLLPEVSTHYVP